VVSWRVGQVTFFISLRTCLIKVISPVAMFRFLFLTSLRPQVRVFGLIFAGGTEPYCQGMT
jgi:hypothetical protein